MARILFLKKNLLLLIVLFSVSTVNVWSLCLLQFFYYIRLYIIKSEFTLLFLVPSISFFGLTFHLIFSYSSHSCVKMFCSFRTVWLQLLVVNTFILEKNIFLPLFFSLLEVYLFKYLKTFVYFFHFQLLVTVLLVLHFSSCFTN